MKKQSLGGAIEPKIGLQVEPRGCTNTARWRSFTPTCCQLRGNCKLRSTML